MGPPPFGDGNVMLSTTWTVAQRVLQWGHRLSDAPFMMMLDDDVSIAERRWPH